MTQHKWDKKMTGTKCTVNEGGDAAFCVKCGCVKEYVKGIPTYFIDDTVYDRTAPECDERLKSQTNE